MSDDILDALFQGKRSLESVESLYNYIMDSERGHMAPKHLGLSREEWTAFGSGVWFDELARWRAHGWPTHCRDCGGPVHVERFGWMAVERPDGDHDLVHITCPGPPAPE